MDGRDIFGDDGCDIPEGAGRCLRRRMGDGM